MRCAMILMSLVLVLGFQAGTSAIVLHVPSEYPTIQAGIDAAVDGDTVLVADGVYYDEGNRDLSFWGKAIVVTSENGPEATIIDCQGSIEDPHWGFKFNNDEDSSAVLKGFTIKNGAHHDYGAIGCYDWTSPTIEGNIFIGNWGFAMGSGGIYCYQGSPTIVGNTFSGNSGCYGGAIGCFESSAPYIARNVLIGNTAGNDGGGFYCEDIYSSPMVVGNVIAGNTAHSNGGGISCRNHCSVILDGNTITENVADNAGGGIICVESVVTVTNCIVWADSCDPFWDAEIRIAGLGASVSVSYSDVQGDSSGVSVDPPAVLNWGDGNMDADPLLVTGLEGDYYLSQPPCQLELSPCVDAGNPDWPVPEGTTRTDGVCDFAPADMGYHYPLPGPLLSVQVTPETTAVHRGEQLWFTVDLVNLTDTTLVFDGWVDGYLFNGNPYARNPVLGPVVVGLGAGQGLYGIRRHVTIPWGAPFGSPYGLCVRTGEHPDSIWAEDCFEFAIVPPPIQ